MHRFILFVLLLMMLVAAMLDARGLNRYQKHIIKIVYNTCEKYKASDGFSFENTCAAITLTESSGGKNLVGDQGKYPSILVTSSLGAMQIRVRTVLEVLKNNLKLRKKYIRFWHPDIDAICKYKNILIAMKYYRAKWHGAHGAQAKIYRIKYYEAKKQFARYRKAYYKDLAIAETLLSDVHFSAIIAANYLILNYEIAKKRGYWNPWFKAVSRYNGGWENTRYVKRVARNLKLAQKYLR